MIKIIETFKKIEIYTENQSFGAILLEPVDFYVDLHVCFSYLYSSFVQEIYTVFKIQNC